MQQLLLSFLLFAASCSASFAQTAAQDSTLSFTASVADAAYVCALESNNFSNIDVAIAKVIAGKTDTSEQVSITLTQRDIASIARDLRSRAEGEGALINARLKTAILPFLPTRPWLAQQMQILFDANDAAYNVMVAEGLRVATRIADAWNSN